MKLPWKKEEEREKVKEKEAVGGRDPKAREEERTVQEMIMVEESHPMDTEEDLVVQTSVENLMAWTHLNLTYACTRQSHGCFESGWIESQSQVCVQEFRQNREDR